MASTPQTPQSGGAGIQPYRMHVSQRYLDLTRQKLRLTRLPKEPQHSQQNWEFGITKVQIEPLIDYWIDQYDWRAREAFYNENLPQFRVTMNNTRIHFVHRKSNTRNAVPLLFIHGWPESFASISKNINALCDPVRTPPRGNEETPAFDVVAPSLPGFGFSDAVQEESNNAQTTADILNALMMRLGYFSYFVHGTGIGFTVARILALRHGGNALGVHTTNPQIPQPGMSFGAAPDNLALSDLSLHPTGLSPPMTPGPSSSLQPQARPQTDAFALTDSPAGLLAHIVDKVRPRARQNQASPNITPLSALQDPWPADALLDWTMLYWLPGPEVALRWLVNTSPLESSLWTGFSNVPLGISMYQDASSAVSTADANRPTWASAFHPVVQVKWRQGKVRFPMWERPDDVVQDIREMVKTLGSQQTMWVDDSMMMQTH
ncbi:alpha/beta-hydrolase [Polychaeton citri CBS 116435]|uniref:Alpha/beta-hydrolase n=1 Tax=Polychaeton citri CBS 116435 TaxID=1314669 RepID=A0A9P4UN22_9PEZI|nr:alpha/beta-hydrolase [Polychaeton citri CBS 116435]